MNQQHTKQSVVEVDTCIIGSGLGGLAAAAQLKEAGFRSIAIFEKARSLGGVWQVNQYPNVACDTPIDLYSFRFYPGSKWTTNFASGREILSYMHDLADAYDLKPLLHCNTEILAAEWNEKRARWNVIAADGQRWSSRFIVWAGGIFSQPVIPEIPGRHRFKGEQLHATNWSKNVVMTGKRVAVVGGGATAIQVVPYAVKQAADLVNFVGTPSYVMPRPDLFFDHETTDPEKFAEQQRERREGWFNQFELIAKTRFPMNHKLIAKLEADWNVYFESVITDSKLKNILTPKYRFGCRRPLFSNDYYPAMREKKVVVVASHVAAVTEEGIVDRDGNEYKVDMIVWATGFSPAAMLGGLKIKGREGRELSEFWGNAPEAYYGTFVKGFPNLIIINGPNVSGASATEFIEAQLRFVLSARRKLENVDGDVIEVSPAAHDSFNADIQHRADESVLVLGNCISYYRAAGTGKVITHWPGTMASFRDEIETKALEGLNFFRVKEAA